MNINMPTAGINKVSCNDRINVAGSIATQKISQSGSPSFCGGTWFNIENKKTIKFIHWLSKDFNSAHQRLLLGVTALMTQPFFDLHNKDVDDKTKVVSCSRTLAKIISGTLTGVLIRQAYISAMDVFCRHPLSEQARVNKQVEKGISPEFIKPIRDNFKKIECILTPTLDMTLKQLQKYKKSMGTLLATLTMLITNFAIDAPMTTALTNFFVKLFTKNEASNMAQQKAEVNNVNKN